MPLSLNLDSLPWWLPLTKSGSSFLKNQYTARKNACITSALRDLFAFENVLRLAGDMKRMRESSGAYILDTSTISFRLDRCRNCDSISR